MSSRIFCAIDTADLDHAISLAQNLQSEMTGFKLGLELFNAQGITGLSKVMEAAGENAELFLDLKFHDIPNTVRGAVQSIYPLNPSYLTVHASGGKAMMQAAKEAAPESARVLGVTVLTNLDEEDLTSIGQGADVEEQVKRLASLAQEAGLDGVVCSPREVEMLRNQCGDDFILMVPGIRPQGSETQDQKRIMTPEEAFAKGASCLVIGRPITQAPVPAQAARMIVEELAL